MYRLILFTLSILLALKLAWVISLGPNPIERDAQGYWDLSSLAMDGDLLLLREPIAFRTPVYPWFLSVVRRIPMPLLAITIAQAGLYLASVILASDLAARISGFRSARILTIVCLLPAFSATTYLGSLLTETFFVFALMLHLWAVMQYVRFESAGYSAVAGITFAIALLTRPIVMLLWVASVALVYVIHRRRTKRWGEHTPIKRGRRGIHGLAFVAVVAVSITPWLVRNERMFGKPFLTEFLGRNIWIVTFQDGSGAGLGMPDSDTAKKLQDSIAASAPSGDWQDIDWRHTWTVSDALVESGLDDAQTDRLMKQVAIEANMQDLQTVAFKAFRRTVNFWRCPATDLPQPAPAFVGFDDYPKTWSAKYPIFEQGYALAFNNRLSQSVIANTIIMLVVGVAVVFLIIQYDSRPFGIWIALILLYFCCITGIVEIPDYRYRMVVEPIAAMAVGATAAILWGSIRGVGPEYDLEIDG